MGKNHRPDRLGGEIKKIISGLLINGIKDPRLTGNMVNVTGVDVTNDGSYAFCYVSILYLSKDEELKKQAREEVLEGLNSAKGLLKKEIAKAVKVRRIPELVFRIDEAAEYGQHIDEILATLPFEDYHAVDPNEVVEDEETDMLDNEELI